MPRWTRRLDGADYEIDTEAGRLDPEAIQHFLAGSYWAEGIPLEVVRAACAGSLCFGLYHVSGPASDDACHQVGFARVVTDRATFGYLADVYVLEAHRGLGLSKWLVECVLAHPELRRLRRFLLATRDAHSLYARYGFRPLGDPAKFMEIARPGLYRVRARR